MPPELEKTPVQPTVPTASGPAAPEVPPAETGETVATEETAVVEPEEPTPEEDFRVLQDLDWLAATLKRFKTGKHPDPQIEGLLQRRLDLDARQFLTFYPIRVLCSLAIVVVGCGTAWVVLWSIFSLAGFTVFLRELSWGMSFLLICLMAFVISNPIRLYDEIEIERAGIERLEQFRRELSGEGPVTGS